MAAFELCLPAMMVSVNEARADDSVAAVHYLDISRGYNIISKLRNLAALNQNVKARRFNVVIGIM